MIENNSEKIDSVVASPKEAHKNIKIENIKNSTKNKTLSIISRPFYAIKEGLSNIRNFIKKKVINKAESIVMKGGEIASSGVKKVVEMNKQTAYDVTDLATLKLTDDPSENDEKGPIPKIIRVPLPFGTAISIILGNIWKKIKNFFSRKK